MSPASFRAVKMLIIEGNALIAADRHGTLGQYVASLAQAGVAALVVELVEGVVRMPDELVLRPGCMG